MVVSREAMAGLETALAIALGPKPSDGGESENPHVTVLCKVCFVPLMSVPARKLMISKNGCAAPPTSVRRCGRSKTVRPLPIEHSSVVRLPHAYSTAYSSPDLPFSSLFSSLLTPPRTHAPQLQRMDFKACSGPDRGVRHVAPGDYRDEADMLSALMASPPAGPKSVLILDNILQPAIRRLL